jgi:hypothetical protein
MKNGILDCLRQLDWVTPEYLLEELDYRIITDYETPEDIEHARKVLTRLVAGRSV